MARKFLNPSTATRIFWLMAGGESDQAAARQHVGSRPSQWAPKPCRLPEGLAGLRDHSRPGFYQSPSLAITSAFTAAGFALPPVAFIT